MIFDPHDIKTYDDTHSNEPICPTTLQRVSAASGMLVLNRYENTLECESCGKFHNIDEIIMRPNPLSDTSEALENDQIQNLSWYHATNSPNWEIHKDKGSFFVHVGSLDSAYDRILNYYARFCKEVYVYKVDVRPDAILAKRFYTDINQNFDTPEFDDFDVCRYINKREDPGSVSLAVRRKFVNVLQRDTVSVQQAIDSGVLWGLDDDSVNEHYGLAT